MNKEQFELALRELKAGKEDIRPSDVAFFSEPLRSALNQAIRIGRISLTDFAGLLDPNATGPADHIHSCSTASVLCLGLYQPKGYFL